MVSLTSDTEESDNYINEFAVVTDVSAAVFSDDKVQDKTPCNPDSVQEEKHFNDGWVRGFHSPQAKKSENRTHDCELLADTEGSTESRVCRTNILKSTMNGMVRLKCKINSDTDQMKEVVEIIGNEELSRHKNSLCTWQKKWESHEMGASKQDFDGSYHDEFPDISVNRRNLQEKSKSLLGIKSDKKSSSGSVDTCSDSDMLEPSLPKGKIETQKDTNRKNKKCRKLRNDELGFTFTLLPRKVESESMTEEREVWSKVEREFDDLSNKLPHTTNFNEIDTQYFKYLRKDRDRKIRKAHLQVKDKNCRSIRNNEGRKKLFAHHRVYKQMELECQRINYLPSKSKCDSKSNFEKGKSKHKKGEIDNRQQTYYKSSGHTAPVQNLAYVLHEDSNPTDLEDDMVSFLMTLQHRDLTPEDYELLLRLDESVAPKTLSMDVLDSFKTDIVDVDSINDICLVCMENYELEQERKFLPCNHVFHSSCIERWLTNSSLNCPIDGLPLS